MAKAKYNAAQLKALGAKGHAFKNPDGSYSYPIDDAEDLGKAISAVGRGTPTTMRSASTSSVGPRRSGSRKRSPTIGTPTAA